MRTRGILLVRDAILLLTFLPVDGEHYAPNSALQLQSDLLPPGTRLGLWRQSCDRVIASLEKFSQNLLDNVTTFRENGDESGVDVIGSSCITCLAHLAVLYEVVGRMGPDAREMYNLCDSALQRLGKLTSDLRFEEYTYLDLLLGVCPFSPCYLTSMTQGRDWDRILGRNRSRSSVSAYRVSRLKRASHCGISGRSSGEHIPIFRPDSPIACRQCCFLWLCWRTVPRRTQSIQTWCRPR